MKTIATACVILAALAWIITANNPVNVAAKTTEKVVDTATNNKLAEEVSELRKLIQQILDNERAEPDLSGYVRREDVSAMIEAALADETFTKPQDVPDDEPVSESAEPVVYYTSDCSSGSCGTSYGNSGRRRLFNGRLFSGRLFRR